MTENSNAINIAQNQGLQDLITWLDLKKAVETQPEPLDFVLPGFKSGTVGALVSPGATGKTMLALQAAVCVAGGPDTLGLANMDSTWQPVPGRAILLSGEDPAEILSSRIHAIGKRLLTPEVKDTLFKNLSIAPLIGCGADILSPTWQEWISDVTRESRLVILDTLRRFHRLDENDGGEMAKLLAWMEQLCRKNSTSLLFLHHTSKAGALAGGDAQQASRGSSVLTDNARFQANLVGMTVEQAKQHKINEDSRRKYVRLLFPKVNYSAPIPDRWFFRNPGGILEPVDLTGTKPEGEGRPRQRHGF